MFRTVSRRLYCNNLNIILEMKLALRLAVLLCAVCAVICYRSPQRAPGGSYSLPSIGKYPSPTVFNPRNQGLPDAYKNTRFRRSMDDQVAPSYEEFAEEQALEELSRQKRSPYRIIYPTYRPPRRGPPKIYRV